MAFSFTKMFKKDESPSDQEGLAKQVSSADEQVAEKSETKTKKHGDEGVCCGSCS